MVHGTEQGKRARLNGSQSHCLPGPQTRRTAHCKPAAEELARRQAIEETRFSRAAEGNFRAEPSATAELEIPPVLSVWDLIQQARDIAGWVEEHRKHRHQWRQAVAVPKDPVTVAGMSEYLRSRLAASEDGRLDVSRLLKDQPTAEHRSCLFLGMLQMAQDRQVEIEQGEVFGPIWLAPGV